MQIHTWSVSGNVMSHCTIWFGDHGFCQYLVLLQDFAIAQAWYVVLRDTTKSAYNVERRGGTSRLGVSLETHAEIVSKAEVKAKL
jgi:hypothetical protein